MNFTCNKLMASAVAACRLEVSDRRYAEFSPAKYLSTKPAIVLATTGWFLFGTPVALVRAE